MGKTRGKMAGAHRVKKDWPTGLIELVREYLLTIQHEGGKILDGGHGPLEAGEKVNLGPYREWREGPRVLVNVYRWDLERKN